MSLELSNTRSDSTALAKELGIKPSLLYRWHKSIRVKQAQVALQSKSNFDRSGAGCSQMKNELRETQMESEILKDCRHFFQERCQIIGLIKAHSSVFTIEKMCSVFQVSRCGFYNWLKREPSNRSMETQMLEHEIRQAFQNSKNTYGNPSHPVAK